MVATYSQDELIVLREAYIKQYGERAYYLMIGGNAAFRATYRADFVALIHDIINWRDDQKPTHYQDEILASVSGGGRTAVQSLHGVGKSTALAWVILAYALTRDGEDWKVPCTASAWRQLKFYLFPEVRKWAARINWAKVGRSPFNERTELQRLSLSLKTGEAFAVASDNPGLIEGAHAESMGYIFDEAKLVSSETFNAAEGAFSSAGTGNTEAFALAASTPGEPSGRFYDICRHARGLEDWKVIRITLEDGIKANRINPNWAMKMGNLWGVESSIYKNRVLGEFAAQDEDAIIPLSWVEKANRRYLEYCKLDETGAPTTEIDPNKLPPLTSVGADISDGGKDETVIAPRYGFVIANVKNFYPKPNTQIETADKIAAIINLQGERAADGKLKTKPVIDGVGVGSGVVSRLNQLKLEPISFIAQAKTDLKDTSGKMGFTNLRTAAYYHLRELLNPETGEDVALPPIPELTADLTTPKYWEVAGSKYALESKDDIAPRLDGRSTDYGDAVVMAFLSDYLAKKRAKSW